MINKADVGRLKDLHKELCDHEVYSYRKLIPDNVNDMVKIVNKHFSCNVSVSDVLTANGPVQKKTFGKTEYSIFMVTRDYFYNCNSFTDAKSKPAISLDKIIRATAENSYLTIEAQDNIKHEILVKKPEYYVAFFNALLQIRDKDKTPNPVPQPQKKVGTPKPLIYDEKTREKYELAVALYNHGKYREAFPIFGELLKKHHPGAAFYSAQIISTRIIPIPVDPNVAAYDLYSFVIEADPDSDMGIKARALRSRYKMLSLLPPDFKADIYPYVELYICAEKDYRYYMNIAEYATSGFLPSGTFYSRAYFYDHYYQGCKDLTHTVQQILKRINLADTLRYIYYLMSKVESGRLNETEFNNIFDNVPISKDFLKCEKVEFVAFKSKDEVLFRKKDGSTFDYPTNELGYMWKQLKRGDKCGLYTWFDTNPFIITPNIISEIVNGTREFNGKTYE